jgi:hypothetical protein
VESTSENTSKEGGNKKKGMVMEMGMSTTPILMGQIEEWTQTRIRTMEAMVPFLLQGTDRLVDNTPKGLLKALRC